MSESYRKSVVSSEFSVLSFQISALDDQRTPIAALNFPGGSAAFTENWELRTALSVLKFDGENVEQGQHFPAQQEH